MGLDTSHDCWHGAYSAFNRWRTKLAEVAGLPPLELMEGFFEDGTLYFGILEAPMWQEKKDNLSARLPIKWEALKPDPLHELLNHSDCEGEIPWESCAAIADSLERLIPLLPDEEGGGHIGNWRAKTQQFVNGLREAAAAKENVDFH